ncbi:hypothetical protein VM98_33550, partial [Streptomyces rubellomurinus subsp. indigoferus]
PCICCDFFQTHALFDDEHHTLQRPHHILNSVARQLAEAARLRGHSLPLLNSPPLKSLRCDSMEVNTAATYVTCSLDRRRRSVFD